MQEKREIKELVFNGGGARGVGMPGVYYALKTTIDSKNSSILDSIETIAGTSVGSLTAAVFSVGPECDELKRDIFDQNLLNILEIERAFLPIYLSLEPLKIFINNYLQKHIKKYLQEQNAATTLGVELLTLLSNLDNESYQITFKDLQALNLYNPKKFKNLIITSTSSNNGIAELNLYDCYKTPLCSIAEACAASSAIPPNFKPVQLNGKYHFDGGCSEPLPSEHFPDKNSLNDTYSSDRQSERLLFVFGPGPSMLGQIWQKTLHGSPNPELVFLDSNEEIQLKQLSLQSLTTTNAPREIYIWIDQNSKKVFYISPTSPAVLHHFSFSELNINDNENFNTNLAADKNEFYRSKFTPYLVNFYTKLVHRNHLNSILGNLSPIWLLNYLSGFIKLLLGFPIYIASLFESLCHRLKTFYSLNTVVLHSNLAGHSFQQAEKTKRTIVATYYLDTMNHLALYNYANPKEQDFYLNIVDYYLMIYQTSLTATNVQTNWYTDRYSNEKNPRVLYEMIKEDVTENPASSRAMALTWAVELHLGQITQEKILIEINEKSQSECKTYSSFFYGHKFKKQYEFSLELHKKEMVLN